MADAVPPPLYHKNEVVGILFREVRNCEVARYLLQHSSSHLRAFQLINLFLFTNSSLKETFHEIDGIYHIKFYELNVDFHKAAPSGASYFCVELSDEERLFYKIRKDFPLQLGREVVCSDKILDVPDRFDWKDCQLSKEQKYGLTEKIKAKFEHLDVKL